MMKGRSQIQLIRAKHQEVQEGICNLFDIRAESYLDFMVDKGYDYIRLDLQLDKWSVDQLTASKIFWSWWRQQWFDIDSRFLKRFPIRKGRSIRQANDIKKYYFNEYHSKANIQCHLEVLKRTYNQMIKRILNNADNAKRGTGKRYQPEIKTKRRTAHANKSA